MSGSVHFTVQYPGRTRVIHSDCSISLPRKKGESFEDFKPIPFKAIWDTGATNSTITKKVVEALGLVPISQTWVQGVHSKVEKNVYAISLVLPNKVVIPFLQVTECDALSGGFDVLIGMDIIGIGDFAITNLNGQTTFSFGIPSTRRLDFTKSESNNSTTGGKKPSFSDQFKKNLRRPKK